MKGREILGPDGKPIRLRGFNLLWWASPNAEAAGDVKELGANCVRYMFGYKPAGRFQAKQVEQVARHVRLFTRRGLWVIPTVHTFERKEDGALRAPWNAPDVQREFLAMWTHWAWVVNRVPVNGTFDVNKHKKGIREAMSRIFAEATGN